MSDRRVYLVVPTNFATGMGIFTPRCLPVLDAATPRDLAGEPIWVDEAIKKMDVDILRDGDIVGISIGTHNCRAGYDLARKARKRGATVVMGGPHVSALHKISGLRDEPLKWGANAVVAGNGDIAWGQVLEDIIVRNNLQERYDGGKIPGTQFLEPRWSVRELKNYLTPSVQTLAGCPEDCSFCSVPSIDGHTPRERDVTSVAKEIIFLAKYFRFILFADDNFFPASLTKIAREKKVEKRNELIQLRENRLAFLRELKRLLGGRSLYFFAQMTAETVDDDEAMHAISDLGVKVVLYGFESFTKKGREDVHKTWGPDYLKAIEVVQKTKNYGIYTYASVICGLPSDTPESIAEMADFVAHELKPLLAQFTIIQGNPGSADYVKMRARLRKQNQLLPILSNDGEYNGLELIEDEFWLKEIRPRMTVKHPTMDDRTIIACDEAAWKLFYSPAELFGRVSEESWPAMAKLIFAMAALGVPRTFMGTGISADSARTQKTKLVPKLLFRGVKGLLNHSLPLPTAI